MKFSKMYRNLWNYFPTLQMDFQVIKYKNYFGDGHPTHTVGPEGGNPA